MLLRILKLVCNPLKLRIATLTVSLFFSSSPLVIAGVTYKAQLITISVASTMYKHFTPELLNQANSDLDQLWRCEYYKNKVLNYCKNDHSSLYEERKECSIVYKQRWCVCMGRRNDCFRDLSFNW